MIAEKKEIMLEMYRPHIKDECWEEFEKNIEQVVETAGPVTKIDVEYYQPNNKVIRKINFQFENGKETYIFEPWRVLLCTGGDWQKEYPEEYQRIRCLLAEAGCMIRGVPLRRMAAARA
jgi:hypothetical protein